MKKLTLNSTLQEVHNYLEKTPEDKWCVGDREDFQGRHCALGWIDLNFDDSHSSVILIKELIPQDPGQLEIVNINNKNGDNPKAAVLEYLKKQISKQIN